MMGMDLQGAMRRSIARTAKVFSCKPPRPPAYFRRTRRAAGRLGLRGFLGCFAPRLRICNCRAIYSVTYGAMDGSYSPSACVWMCSSKSWYW